MKLGFLSICAGVGATLLFGISAAVHAQGIFGNSSSQGARSPDQAAHDRVIADQRANKERFLQNLNPRLRPPVPNRAYCPPISNTYIYLGSDSDGFVVTGLPSTTYFDSGTGLVYSNIEFPLCFPGLPQSYTCLPSNIYLTNPQSQIVYVGGPIPAAAIIQSAPQAAPQTVYNVYNYNTYNNYYGSSSAPSATASAPDAQSSDSSSPQSTPAKPNTSSAPPAGMPADKDAAQLAAMFQDVSRSWMRNDISLMRKHFGTGSNVSIFINGQYQYSIASSEFLKATDQAFDYLYTRSFSFDSFRSQTNGDITAYATQSYYLRTDGANAALKTVSLSYTFGKRNGEWVIVAIDSIKQAGQPSAS